MPRAWAVLVVAAALGLGVGPAPADTGPAGKSKPTRVPRAYSGRMVTLASGADTIDAYLAAPARPTRGTLVVVHEWWGLNDWAKKVANRFAAAGYLTIAPDLYRGKVAKDAELAHELSRGLPEERAIRDIRAAGAFVRARGQAAGDRGGVVGFCMGGGLALRAALDGAPFQATVICYGSPVTEPERLKTLAGPVLGIFGGEDRGIGFDQTSALEKGLKDAGVVGAVHVYSGVGHAFLNEERPGYKPDVARQAWDEIDSFLAKSVAGP